MTDDIPVTVHLSDGIPLSIPVCPDCGNPMRNLVVGLHAYMHTCGHCESKAWRKKLAEEGIELEWRCSPGTSFGGMQDGKPVIWARGDPCS